MTEVIKAVNEMTVFEYEKWLASDASNEATQNYTNACLKSEKETKKVFNINDFTM
jgi:hypothetical protein